MSIAIGCVLIVLGILGFVFSYMNAWEEIVDEMIYGILFGAVNLALGILEITAFSMFQIPVGVVLGIYSAQCLVLVFLAMRDNDFKFFCGAILLSGLVGFPTYWQFSSLF